MFTFLCHLPNCRVKTITSAEMAAGWSPVSAEAALLNIAHLWSEGRVLHLKGGVLDEDYQWRCDSAGKVVIRQWRKFGPNQLGTVYLDDGTVVEIWNGNISG